MESALVLVLVPILIQLAAACDGEPSPSPTSAPDTVADAGGGADSACDIDPAPPDGAGPPSAWQVGVAAVDVTPRAPVVMGGYGIWAGGLEQCRWSEGVRDPLLATAFAIRRGDSDDFVVFVGVDSVGLMQPDILAIQDAFAAKVAAATGERVDGGRLVVSGSHDHSSPDTVGIWGSTPDEPGRDEEWIAALVDGAASAAADALLGAADAELAVARTWLDNEPRVQSDAHPMEMDGRMTVLRATTPDGALLGTLTVWAAHPCIYGVEMNGLSGDWVGVFREHLRTALGGGVHAYVQGAVGGVYPLDRSERCADAPDPFADAFVDPDVPESMAAAVACAGFLAADAALAAIGEAEPLAPGPLDVRTRAFELTITNEMYFLLDEWGMLPRPIERGVPVTTRTTLARVGPLRFVTAPGEAFPRYAAALRAAVGQADGVPDEDVVVVGLGGDWLGYLLLPEQYADPAYGYNRGLCPTAAALDAHLAALAALLAE